MKRIQYPSVKMSFFVMFPQCLLQLQRRLWGESHLNKPLSSSAAASSTCFVVVFAVSNKVRHLIENIQFVRNLPVALLNDSFDGRRRLESRFHQFDRPLRFANNSTPFEAGLTTIVSFFLHALFIAISIRAFQRLRKVKFDLQD